MAPCVTTEGGISAIKCISSRLDQVQQSGQQSTQDVAEAKGKAQSKLPRISMTDFANTGRPVWRNVEYNDTDTKNSIMQEAHNAMVAEGAVLKVTDDVAG